jgi:hypothetical protein
MDRCAQHGRPGRAPASAARGRGAGDRWDVRRLWRGAPGRANLAVRALHGGAGAGARPAVGGVGITGTLVDLLRHPTRREPGRSPRGPSGPSRWSPSARPRPAQGRPRRAESSTRTVLGHRMSTGAQMMGFRAQRPQPVVQPLRPHPRADPPARRPGRRGRAPRGGLGRPLRGRDEGRGSAAGAQVSRLCSPGP